MSDDRQTRRRGRPKTVDRQRVIAQAMEHYWREGIHALSLNEVCRRASLAKPALYREFGDEDGLKEAVLLEYREQVLLPVLRALTRELPFAEIAQRLIVGMSSDRGTPAGCLFTQMRFVRQRLGPATKARLEALEQERRQGFEAWYRKAQERAEVSSQIDPALAAHYIDTQLTAVLMQMKTDEPVEMVRAQARLAFEVLLTDGAKLPTPQDQPA